MSSKSPGKTTGNPNPDYSGLPRGILGRRGVPVARGARLPSVRGPRDLTLGGAAAQKRTFTPNIPVRKEKQKDEENKSKIETNKRDGRRNPRQRGSERGGRGRGRGRGAENLIQLEGGIFGEGPMASNLKKSFGSGGSRYENEGSSSNHIQPPKYNPGGIRTKQEKEDEEKMLERLYRDDFIDDLDDQTKKVDPITLPLLSFEVKKEIVPIKNIVKIKKEPKDEDDQPMDTTMNINPESVVVKIEAPSMEESCQTKFKEMSLLEILASSKLSETGNLFLFQFPDSLPGALGKSDDEDHQNRSKGAKNDPSTSKTTEDVADVSPDQQNCSLADLPEGFIGKLRMMKSGKCELFLGSIGLKVELGTNIGFLQELVSVHDKEEELIVLGNIERNIVCHPDMENLLIKSNKEPT